MITLLHVYPTDLKTLCPYEDLHTNVFSSLIDNCPKLEVIKMFPWANG